MNRRESRNSVQRRGNLQAGQNIPNAILTSVDHARRLFEAGQNKDAITFLREKCNSGQNHPYLLSVLGAYEVQTGLNEIGLQHSRDAANLSENNFVILSNLGSQLTALGHAGEAVDVLSKAARLSPDTSEIRYTLAKALLLSEQFDAAEKSVRTYIEACPDDLLGHILLIDILEQSDQTDAAITHCTELIREYPLKLGVHNKYVDCLVSQGQLNQALSHLKVCRAQSGFSYDPALMQKNIDVLALCGDFDAAINLTQIAISQFPDYPSFRYQSATMLLSLGRLDEGWNAFSKLDQWAEDLAKLPHPKWRGECLAGKTLLIRGAEGVGEQLMYSQLLPKIHERVGKLLVELDYRLVNLFSRVYPDIEFIGYSDPPQSRLTKDDIDFQCYPVDLGHEFLKTFDQFHGPPQMISHHNVGIEAGKTLRTTYPKARLIGISWRSASRMGGNKKSFSLNNCRNIIQCNGAKFINLQYGSSEIEVQNAQKLFGVEILSAEGIDTLRDIDPMVGLVSELDLVITVSNVNAHYAGLAQTPVWVIVPKLPLWHWFRGRDDNPWYPTAKLYRQEPSETWAPVLSAVSDDLAKWLSE